MSPPGHTCGYRSPMRRGSMGESNSHGDVIPFGGRSSSQAALFGAGADINLHGRRNRRRYRDRQPRVDRRRGTYGNRRRRLGACPVCHSFCAETRDPAIICVPRSPLTIYILDRRPQRSGAYFESTQRHARLARVIVAALLLMCTGTTVADPIIGAGIGLSSFPSPGDS